LFQAETQRQEETLLGQIRREKEKGQEKPTFGIEKGMIREGDFGGAEMMDGMKMLKKRKEEKGKEKEEVLEREKKGESGMGETKKKGNSLLFYLLVSLFFI
jgi:hypothetical protein